VIEDTLQIFAARQFLGPMIGNDHLHGSRTKGGANQGSNSIIVSLI
jgi:hypothetical protein